jgi:hypothetical protein
MGALITSARASIYAAILIAGTGTPVLAASGGLERSDWLTHVPLAIAVITFVTVVDALVIARIVRARRRAGR